MKFISENKISEELVNSFDEEMTLELAKRLEEDNYNTPFDGLKDWHLLRALAINRPELTCLLYTSPSPRDQEASRMPSSA